MTRAMSKIKCKLHINELLLILCGFAQELESEENVDEADDSWICSLLCHI